MRRGWLFRNAAHHDAVFKHVVVVVVPLAGRARGRAFEDEAGRAAAAATHSGCHDAGSYPAAT
jgi:hypothetical protein